MILTKKLRQFYQVEGQELIELYKREFLFSTLWLGQFEGEDRHQAREALISIFKKAETQNTGYPNVIADGIENFSLLPTFVQENTDKFMFLVNYLAFGDSEITRKIPRELHEQAKREALEAYKEDLKQEL